MIPADAVEPEIPSASSPAQCIEIAGADARTFSQAQFSGDVRMLQAGHWQWNAWLDPKGTVRALMHLADLGDGRLLALLRGGDARSLCIELRRYVLRSKVSLEVPEVWHRRAGAGLPLGTIHMQAGAIGFGYGDRSLWLERGAGIGAEPADDKALRLAEIHEGWPTLPAGGHALLPPALGLEHLGAVAFGKGCYPGQEIAARLHYRGGHKLRLAHVRSDSELIPGGPLSPSQQRTIVLDSLTTRHGCEALAVLDESAEPLHGIGVVRKFDA